MSNDLTKRRLPGLDGLRALSAGLVLLFHADMGFSPRAGFIGVDIFFVLSGFLITGLLLSEFEQTHRLDLTAFYLRRLRRLAPVMLACLSMCIVAAIWWAPDSIAGLRQDVPYALTYTTNWWEIFNQRSYFEAVSRPPLLIHLWSLAIEEQFYLLWPMLVWAALRFGNKGLVAALSVGLAIVSTLVLIQLSLNHGYPLEADPTRAYFGTDSHTMGLMFGACAAVVFQTTEFKRLQQRPINPLWDILGAGIFASLLLIAYRSNEVSEWLYYGGFSLLAVLTAVLLLILTHPGSLLSQGLEHRYLRSVGERSYGLYVWHWPVFSLLRPGMDWPYGETLTFIARIALTLALTTVTYRWLEQPIRKLNRPATMRQATDHEIPDKVAFEKRRGQSLAIGLVVVMLLSWASLYSVATPTPALLKEPEAPIEPVPNQSPALKTVTPFHESAGSVLAIGDSVLLGASPYLSKRFPGLEIDAEVGRQAAQVLHILEQRASANALPERVILHLGTNGYVTEDQLNRMLTLLKDKQVVLINASAPRRWVTDNNELFTKAAADHAQLKLIDWNSESADHPEYFVSDHIHLKPLGIRAFAQVIAPIVPNNDLASRVVTEPATANPTVTTTEPVPTTPEAVSIEREEVKPIDNAPKTPQ